MVVIASIVHIERGWFFAAKQVTGALPSIQQMHGHGSLALGDGIEQGFPDSDGFASLWRGLVQEEAMTVLD